MSSDERAQMQTSVNTVGEPSVGVAGLIAIDITMIFNDYITMCVMTTVSPVRGKGRKIVFSRGFRPLRIPLQAWDTVAGAWMFRGLPRRLCDGTVVECFVAYAIGVKLLFQKKSGGWHRFGGCCIKGRNCTPAERSRLCDCTLATCPIDAGHAGLH